MSKSGVHRQLRQLSRRRFGDGADPIDIAAAPEVGESDHQDAEENQDVGERDPGPVLGAGLRQLAAYFADRRYAVGLKRGLKRSDKRLRLFGLLLDAGIFVRGSK